MGCSVAPLLPTPTLPTKIKLLNATAPIVSPFTSIVFTFPLPSLPISSTPFPYYLSRIHLDRSCHLVMSHRHVILSHTYTRSDVTISSNNELTSNNPTSAVSISSIKRLHLSTSPYPQSGSAPTIYNQLFTHINTN